MLVRGSSRLQTNEDINLSMWMEIAKKDFKKCQWVDQVDHKTKKYKT